MVDTPGQKPTNNLLEIMVLLVFVVLGIAFAYYKQTIIASSTPTIKTAATTQSQSIRQVTAPSQNVIIRTRAS